MFAVSSNVPSGSATRSNAVASGSVRMYRWPSLVIRLIISAKSALPMPSFPASAAPSVLLPSALAAATLCCTASAVSE